MTDTGMYIGNLIGHLAWSSIADRKAACKMIEKVISDTKKACKREVAVEYDIVPKWEFVVQSAIEEAIDKAEVTR